MPFHSLLTELLVAGYSVLGDVYKMLILKVRPQKCHYGQKSCYKLEVRPVGFRVATSNSVNRLCFLNLSESEFTQVYQKFLHLLGVQQVRSQKSSDNVEKMAECNPRAR